jgi:hypothetical protein
MPKPILGPAPTSSVARLFDSGAAARALAPVDARAAGADAVPVPRSAAAEHATAEPTSPWPAPPQAGVPGREPLPATGEPANLKRELVLTRSADEAFTRLVDLYRRSTGTRLTGSHVARAMLSAVAHAMPYVEREARRLGAMRLPGNARGREGERERFEAEIARAFLRGLRAAADLEPGER